MKLDGRTALEATQHTHSAMKKYTVYAYYILVIFPMLTFSEIGILWFLIIGEPRPYSEYTIYDSLSLIFWSFLAQWLGVFSLVVTIMLQTKHRWIRVVTKISEMPMMFIRRLFGSIETREIRMERVCACGQNHGRDLERYEIHERAFRTTGEKVNNRNATVLPAVPQSIPSATLLYTLFMLVSIGISTLLYFVGYIIFFLVGGVLVSSGQIYAGNVYTSYYLSGLFVVFVMAPMLGTILIAKVKNPHRDIVVGVIALASVLYVAIGFVTNHIAFWPI